MPRREDHRSPEARQYRALYNTARWKHRRAAFIAEHPLCEPCSKMGRVTATTVVNHRKPHKGDETLFWDEGNWQPMCKPCHDGPTQSRERTGRDYDTAIGADGFPVDPNHPANR